VSQRRTVRAQLDAALDGTGIRGLLVPCHLEVSAWAPPEDQEPKVATELRRGTKSA
jgi:hypothetical protein